jgi:acetyl esterase/lipase
MPFTINHKGAINTKAVLDWVYEQLEAPKKVFVTGCSAGGYGSIFWAPWVQQHYAKSRVYHLSDSAAGVITPDFFQRSFPSWNVRPHYPEFTGSFDNATSLAVVYKSIAAYYPNNTYSEYNTILDSNQTFYYLAMGGKDKEEWSQQMRASLRDIQDAAPNFRAFVAEGEQHCILPAANFYDSEAGGKKLSEWMSDMVNDRPLDSRTCETCSF